MNRKIIRCYRNLIWYAYIKQIIAECTAESEDRLLHVKNARSVSGKIVKSSKTRMKPART